MTERNYRKYKFVRPDGTVARSGITRRELEIREKELQREVNREGRVVQVGRATSEKAAREWEDRQHTGTPPGGKR